MAVDRVAGSEANCPKSVNRLEASLGISLVDARQTTDTEPSSIDPAGGPRGLPILLDEEAHLWSEEMARVVPVNGTVTAVADTATGGIPAEDGKALAASGEI